MRVLLERQTVCLEQLTEDVKEIKAGLPHNASERLGTLEKDVTSLNKWKYGLTMLTGFVVGIFEFIRDRN